MDKTIHSKILAHLILFSNQVYHLVPINMGPPLHAPLPALLPSMWDQSRAGTQLTRDGLCDRKICDPSHRRFAPPPKAAGDVSPCRTAHRPPPPFTNPLALSTSRRWASPALASLNHCLHHHGRQCSTDSPPRPPKVTHHWTILLQGFYGSREGNKP